MACKTFGAQVLSPLALRPNRVVKMTLHGSATADLRLTGDDFRSRLGLRSTWFSLSIG